MPLQFVSKFCLPSNSSSSRYVLTRHHVQEIARDAHPAAAPGAHPADISTRFCAAVAGDSGEPVSCTSTGWPWTRNVCTTQGARAGQNRRGRGVGAHRRHVICEHPQSSVISTEPKLRESVCRIYVESSVLYTMRRIVIWISSSSIVCSNSIF